MKPILVVQDLWKVYWLQTVLQKLSFEVFPGEVIGVLGANGSGKSTLLRILAGVSSHTEGAIFFKEEPLSHKHQQHIAYLPDINPYFPKWSIQQTFDFLSAFYPSWEMNKAYQFLKLMELDPKKRVGNLSKGQAAKLKLVCAFAHESELVLLDEPLEGVDVIAQEALMEVFLKKTRSSNQAVIMSTHALHEMGDLFDRIMVIQEGQFLYEGTSADIKQQYGDSIKQAFVKLLSPKNE